MTDLVRPTPGSGDIQYEEWIGRIALALIFLLIPLLIIGRVLPIAAGIALVVGWHERVAAICGGLCFVAFRSIPSLPSHIAEIHASASR